MYMYFYIITTRNKTKINKLFKKVKLSKKEAEVNIN